jgi:import inner membrane translocase subunit TIM44
MYIKSLFLLVGSIFEESDQAQAIRAFQAIDPTFNMDKFMTDARKYIVPELMEAYLKGDVETLKLWCSEAVSPNRVISR